MASLKKVFQNTILYSLSTIILRASSVIFFPIFSFYLTKQDYGILSITQTIMAIVVCLAGLEINRGITRFIYKDSKLISKEYIFSLMGAAFVLSLATTLIFSIVLMIAGPFLLKNILNEVSFYPYMVWSILALPFTSVVDLFKTYLKATHQGKRVFVIDMLYFGGNIALNLLFIIVFKTDVLGIILSTLVVGIVFFIYCYFSFFRKTKITFNLKVLAPILKYSLPLLPFILLGILIESIDKIFLNSTVSVDISGIYYIAITFASIFSVVKESLNIAFTPWFFEHFNKSNYQFIKELINVIILGSAILVVLVSIFSFEVLSILSSNKQLILAWEYIPFITISLYIVFLGQLYNMPTYYSDKHTRYLYLSNLIGFLVNLLLCVLLVEKLQIYGALIAKLVGFMFMAFVQFFISVKASDFRFNNKIVLLSFLGVCIFSFIQYIPINYGLVLCVKLLFLIISGIIFSYYIQIKYQAISMLKNKVAIFFNN